VNFSCLRSHLAWGAANIHDQPLSTGSYKAHHEGERAPVAVVPTEALKKHAKQSPKAS